MSPSDAAWQQLISALHASGRKAALAITGGGSGAARSALGGRTRSRHRPTRWPNDAVGAAALCAVPRFFQPDARGTRIAGAGRRRAQAASLGIRNLRHKRRQAAVGGRDSETPARAIRLEV